MNVGIQKLRKSFENQKIDALLVTDPLNIRYLTGFVGLAPREREAYVLVTNNECYLITDGRYIEQARQLKKDMFKDGQKRTRIPFCPLTILEIRPKDSVFKLLKDLMAKLEIKRLGCEAKDLTFSEYQKLKRIKCTKTADGRGQKWYKFSLVPTKDLVENLRATKEQGEIKKIKKAVQIADQCFAHLLKFIRSRLTEGEIVWEIEKFLRENGAELAFKPIVASGSNSALPHHATANEKLKTQDIILLDFGAKIDGYCSDMTRMIFLGKPSQEQRNIYNIVLEAQKMAIEKLSNLVIKKLGAKAKNIDKCCRDFLKKTRLPDIPHSLGHGVGLSEHEKPRLSPRSKDLLKPSMVFTIEPGVYLPGKFGIRIEDLVSLEKNKVKILTKTRRELIEI